MSGIMATCSFALMVKIAKIHHFSDNGGGLVGDKGGRGEFIYERKVTIKILDHRGLLNKSVVEKTVGMCCTRLEVWRENLVKLKSNSYVGSQNLSDYGQRSVFVGLPQKAATYHRPARCTGDLRQPALPGLRAHRRRNPHHRPHPLVRLGYMRMRIAIIRRASAAQRRSK